MSQGWHTKVGGNSLCVGSLFCPKKNLWVICRVLVLLHCKAGIFCWNWVHTHSPFGAYGELSRSALKGWLVKWLKVGWDVIICLWGPILHQVIIVYEHCCEVRRETFQPKETLRYNPIIVVIFIPAYCGSTYTMLVQTQGKKCSLPQRASKLRMRQETTDGHR